MSEAAAFDREGEEEFRRAPLNRAERAGPDGRGLLDIYKPGQGYHTRIWSGVAYGTLVCWLAYFLYRKLEIVGSGTTTRYIQVGTAVGIILVFGMLGYWLLALNRKVCDFLIATEGEMKKVNWTSRKEIIGSTKVVVFVVIVMTILLFVVDVFFIQFFSTIGVLRGGGMMDTLKGLF